MSALVLMGSSSGKGVFVRRDDGPGRRHPLQFPPCRCWERTGVPCPETRQRQDQLGLQ